MPETTVVSPPPNLAESVERIVLVGFMGAGKSTVGPLLARALGWRFVDLDGEVERTEGSSVAALIRTHGIEHFREVEANAGRRVLRCRRIVVAAGGGWAAEPGHMDMLDELTLAVWLQVTPETALARMRTSRGSRPLLDVDDPVDAARDLLQGRTAHYSRSDITIDTEDRSPAGVVREIMRQPVLCGVDMEDFE